jgi:hypothetical protein
MLVVVGISILGLVIVIVSLAMYMSERDSTQVVTTEFGLVCVRNGPRAARSGQRAVTEL